MQVQQPILGLKKFSSKPIIVSLPGYDPERNLVDFSINGIWGNPTGDWRPINELGKVVQFHPSGGSYGAKLIDFTNNLSGYDFTIIWVGVPNNLVNPGNGTSCSRGKDGFGNGWSMQMGAQTNYVAVSITDQSPASYTAQLLTTIGYKTLRYAGKKINTTLTVFHHESRTSSSANCGNGNLRTSSKGFSIAGDPGGTSSGTGIGHNQCYAFYVFDGPLTDQEIWGLLDNPLSIFKPNARLTLPRSVIQSLSTIPKDIGGLIHLNKTIGGL